MKYELFTLSILTVVLSGCLSPTSSGSTSAGSVDSSSKSSNSSTPQTNVEPSADVRPIGTATITKNAYSCTGSNSDSYVCYDVSIACPEVQDAATVTFFVKAPQNPIGTITFHSGSSGAGFWTGGASGYAQGVLDDLVAAGYRAVQVKWKTGWNTAGTTYEEGPMKLACRAATAIRWVHDHLASANKPFCVTGNSGGSVQVSYAISHYGLSPIIDAVVPTSGPGLGDIEEGCLDPASPLYLVGQTGLFDSMYGAAKLGGPCTSKDENFRTTFHDDSISFGNWDYYYPKTFVWMIGGAQDTGTATTAQSQLFYDRLNGQSTPYLQHEILANSGHSVQDSLQGSQEIKNVMLTECKIHPAVYP